MLLPDYKILLFDVDWTLIAKGKRRNIHDEAFYYAFEKVYGMKVAQKESEEGWIDSQIIIETVIKQGISEEEAKSNIPQALTAMIDYFMKHAKEGRYDTMPGTKEEKEKILKFLEI